MFFFIILRCLYDHDHKMTGASATLEINLSRTKLYMYYHQVSNLGDAFHAFFLLLLTRKGKDYTTRSSKLFFFEHQISYHYRLFCGRTSNIFIIGSEESFFSPPNLLLTHHDHFFRSNRSSKTTYINMHISWPHGDKKPLCTTWEIQIQHMGTTWYNLATT